MTIREAPLYALILAVLMVPACGDPNIFLECVPANGLIPDCRFQNPEDLALLPDGETLVVSQFGGLEQAEPGSLALFNTRTSALSIAFPTRDAAPGVPSWGDPACPGPPDESFSPHGIDLETGPDGSLRLLVVNHGGRESVEFFEVLETANGYALDWRGCAPAADEDDFFNDVVGLRDGGLLVTHMMPKSSNFLGLVFRGFVLGMNTGFVYEWQPAHGYHMVPGTGAGMPNGIEKSLDERYVFVNAYFFSEVRKVDRKTGELVGVAAISKPDNITWGLDGRLLVASHTAGTSDQLACDHPQEGVCGYSFAIVALEPVTMETTTVLEQDGPPMGAATVATPVGDRIYLGTYAGDRISSFEHRIANEQGER